MQTETEITDVIIELIEDNVDLPDHGQRRYVEPRSLRKDVKNRWLAVYPDALMPDLLATPDSYYTRLQLKVAWYAPVFDGADTNTREEDTVSAALDEARAIREYLVGLADGVDGLTNTTAVVLGVVYDVRGSLGWVAELTLEIEQFE
jgi:hypothetical protein